MNSGGFKGKFKLGKSVRHLFKGPVALPKICSSHAGSQAKTLPFFHLFGIQGVPGFWMEQEAGEDAQSVVT